MSLDASDNSMIRTVMWYWIISRGTLPFGCTKRLSSPGPVSTWPFSSLSSQHPSTCSRCDVFIPSRQIVSPLLKWRWQDLACQDYNFLFRRFALFDSMWDHWRIKGTMKVALDEEPEPLMWRQPVCELTLQLVARGRHPPEAPRKVRTQLPHFSPGCQSLKASGFL